jgi:hypothetical protein
MLYARSLAKSVITVVSLACCAGHVTAQQQAFGLELELNKIEQTDSGCRLTFKSTNRMPAKLESFSLEVYLLDPKGVALQSVQFSFGAIAASKARFAKFDLKDRPCKDIGGVFINEFKSCMADKDIAQQCRDTLILNNLTTVSFSDGAP